MHFELDNNRYGIVTTRCRLTKANAVSINGLVTTDSPFNGARFVLEDGKIVIRDISFTTCDEGDLDLLVPLYQLLITAIPEEAEHDLVYIRMDGSTWVVDRVHFTLLNRTATSEGSESPQGIFPEGGAL